MKLYVTVEEFLYAKKIENQTERTLRGYKNALNLFANWLQKEWTIDELEKIRVIHLKQYVAYHLKMGHKATYVNGIIKILRAFFKYTNGEDYTDIAYEKVAWVREEKPVIKAFSAQDARQLLEYYDNKSYLSCRNRTIITMFLETGIRCKELIDMQPEDIKENYILIHGKNHKERLYTEKVTILCFIRYNIFLACNFFTMVSECKKRKSNLSKYCLSEKSTF